MKNALFLRASAAVIFLLALHAFLAGSVFAADGWIELFNGKNLDGWVQQSGKVRYWVEDGTLVGATVANTGNSFLCTTRSFGDFVLELEFMAARPVNSGIQFRSRYFDRDTEQTVKGKKQRLPAFRVCGYQYEIDAPAVGSTGGVYDEATGRGWLARIADDNPARNASKLGEWNQVRIECKGDHIQTWINGVKAVDFHDSAVLRGIIALQVHSIGDGVKNKPGAEIRFRRIRLKEL
jgi:hypothetical protein